MNSSQKKTSKNKTIQINLALNYGSKFEILNAIKKLSINKDKINEKNLSKYLLTKNIPDPELLIRTGDKKRLSNFLLWQIAYAELYFTEVFWPDFSDEDLYKAIASYQKRERRFGKTSEQLN